MIKRFIASIVIFVVAVIIGISIYLQPNDLRSCGDVPSVETNCQVVDAIVAISGGDTKSRVDWAIDLYKNGVKVADCSAFCHSSGGNNNTSEDLYVTVPSVINGDIIEIRQQRMECLHYTSGVDAYGQSAGYMELISATDGYDSFSVTDQGKQYWNVTKYYGDGCIFNSYVSSVSEGWVNQ